MGGQAAAVAHQARSQNESSGRNMNAIMSGGTTSPGLSRRDSDRLHAGGRSQGESPVQAQVCC